MCINTWKTTSSLLWREFSWKVQMRYFKTPIIQSKYNKDITASCWRNCGEKKANHTHILYSCPVLNQFWSKVKEEIDNIFQCNLSLSPKDILLGKSPQALSLPSDKYLYRILRITAIKQITKNWMNAAAPQIIKWKETIKEIYVMEKITHRIRNISDVFETRWERITKTDII